LNFNGENFSVTRKQLSVTTRFWSGTEIIGDFSVFARPTNRV